MSAPGDEELAAIAAALYARAARETPAPPQPASRWLEAVRRANVRVDLPERWRG